MSQVKDFAQALTQINDNTTARDAMINIVDLMEKVPEESRKHLLNAMKKVSDTVSQQIKECGIISEGEGTKKSIKELIGEIFPSLSFYPALGIWGMVDKIIQSDKGFNVLTPEQSRLLAVYTALFFGLVGSKIAYNRLKERLVSTSEADKQIQEVMEAAGVTSNLDDALKFIADELELKFGSNIPQTDEEENYREDLINMASMKFNVPDTVIKDKLGIHKEVEQDVEISTEEVPGEEITESINKMNFEMGDAIVNKRTKEIFKIDDIIKTEDRHTKTISQYYLIIDEKGNTEAVSEKDLKRDFVLKNNMKFNSTGDEDYNEDY